MRNKIIIAIIILATLLVLVLWRRQQPAANIPANTNTNNTNTTNSLPANNTNSSQASTPPESSLALPIDRASERITKKLFGTYVTPQNSPVSPEKFTGYHTGLDFETFADEQNSDVVINVICNGPLLSKRTASGYGGVAVQKCTINNQTVTVIYGHMKLTSISAVVGTNLNAGDKLGVLGTGFSSETDGERKHLHLGIHKGATVTITGYVSSQSALAAWMDPKTVLGL